MSLHTRKALPTSSVDLIRLFVVVLIVTDMFDKVKLAVDLENDQLLTGQEKAC